MLLAMAMCLLSSARESSSISDSWAPLSWTTVGDRLYSFCSEQDALTPAAAGQLAKTSLMIHGMEVGANLPPVWENSEMKVGLAAAQLRKLNPAQLQLYTV